MFHESVLFLSKHVDGGLVADATTQISIQMKVKGENEHDVSNYDPAVNHDNGLQPLHEMKMSHNANRWFNISRLHQEWCVALHGCAVHSNKNSSHLFHACISALTVTINVRGHCWKWKASVSQAPHFAVATRKCRRCNQCWTCSLLFAAVLISGNNLTAPIRMSNITRFCILSLCRCVTTPLRFIQEFLFLANTTIFVTKVHIRSW